MASNTTTDAPEEQTHGEPADAASDRLESLRTRATDGTAALVGGGVALVLALRALLGDRGRAGRRALVGAALVAVGLRQRRADHDAAEDLPGGSASGTTASRRRSVANSTPETPAATGPEGESGDRVEFTDDTEAADTHPAGDETAGDPRTETDDESVEVDVSETAMADEPNEATGPSPEQAMPAETEGTEPEPTPDEDVSHVEADVPTGGSDAESDVEDETADAESEADETTGAEENEEREYTEENTTEEGADEANAEES